MGGPHAGIVGRVDPPRALNTERLGDVLVLRIDDGKRNALDHALLDDLTAALADAGDAKAIALIGRPGCFCAGFDLATIRTQGAAELFGKGGQLALSLFTSEVPIVFGVTGHALAMGAVLLCVADLRIGADIDDAKIGLNEVRIGLPLPAFAVEVARHRLDPRRLERSLQLAEVVAPSAAVGFGWLDEVCAADLVADRAIEAAAELAANLEPAAFIATRRALRGELAKRLATIS